MSRAGQCLLALALTLPGGAWAKDGLSSLVPLVEVYAVDAKVTPGFDVAGIRCAALYSAQALWAQDHGGRGPGRKAMQDVELHLTRAELFRREQGESVTAAHDSTLADVQAVMALYAQRFGQNAGAGRHPWLGDGLIRSDLSYCRLLGN